MGECLDIWFRLFGRVPEADGYELFRWILHGLEAQPGSNSLAVSGPPVRRGSCDYRAS